MKSLIFMPILLLSVNAFASKACEDEVDKTVRTSYGTAIYFYDDISYPVYLLSILDSKPGCFTNIKIEMEQVSETECNVLKVTVDDRSDCG